METKDNMHIGRALDGTARPVPNEGLAMSQTDRSLSTILSVSATALLLVAAGCTDPENMVTECADPEQCAGGAIGFDVPGPDNCQSRDVGNGYVLQNCDQTDEALCDVEAGVCWPAALVGLVGTPCGDDNECRPVVQVDGVMTEAPGTCLEDLGGCTLPCGENGLCPIGSVCTNFATTDVFTCRPLCWSDCD